MPGCKVINRSTSYAPMVVGWCIPRAAETAHAMQKETEARRGRLAAIAVAPILTLSAAAALTLARQASRTGDKPC